ncbi:hypothetical protein TTHERM_00706260 (macronuclear) [Tetrahymena thermophila SB210]|uniref:Uncharacterized protein n=1 Tax=Tetrahymena thermophila (strain SB210) TaxID=312017 RepID=I7M778_TETTS|nr:hypothetical protein TTHERM_00706260 [Tetrahymena thermophila SB210]EAR90711.1 hypothetical protein TTHERM_00706260 [Tetrahymena thermophila SB210]|eukprot:XP_001010956.1 hypothetical protein TTHERM_00706260 [Tetrahymena thermophila SB210]
MFWKQQSSAQSCVQTNNIQTKNNSNYNSKLANGFHPIPQELIEQTNITTHKHSNIQQIVNTNTSPLKSGNSTQVSVESDDYLDSRTLPPNFEKNIRELEVIIEETPEIELDKIKELIMLYTLAVEYYDSNNDDKFIYYKNKIVHLHQQANVIKAMNKYVAPRQQNPQIVKSPIKSQIYEKQKSENYASESSSSQIQNIRFESEESQMQITAKEKEKKQIETKEKMKGFEEKAVVGITDAIVTKLIDIQDENVIEQEIIIEKDLKKQTNNILKRLNKRIKIKEKCSTPPSGSSKKFHLNLDVCKTECSNFDAGVEQYISNAPPKQALTSRQHRQKPSISVIDSIVANFISDKKRSLNEEKNFKIDQIEFEYEKLSFQLEKSKTQLTEEEKMKLELEKENKIRMIEEEYILKEKQEIEIIHQKYYKYDLNKSKESSPIKNSVQTTQDQKSQPEINTKQAIKLVSSK